jgi:hypothetical protein
MEDYGGMEKVGQLPQSLPRNDHEFTTEPGDLVLYQGTAFVIYYAPNTWNLTKLGHIDGLTQADLLAVLGDGDVTVTLSAADDTKAVATGNAMDELMAVLRLIVDTIRALIQTLIDSFG